MSGDSEADWFQVGHDAGHTAHVPSAGGAPSIVRWEFGPHEYVSTPIVVGDSVYVTADVPKRGLLGNLKRETKAVLFRIDAAEGATERVASSGDANGWGSEDLIFYRGRFYLASNTDLFALDARTGNVTWRSDGVSVLATPTADDGRVAVACRNAACCFDAESGERLWHNPIPDDQFLADSPAMADGRVVYVENDGNTEEAPQSATVRAVEADTGTELWSKQTNVVSYGMPVVADGTVYLGNRKYVYAFDAATGERRWRTSIARPDFVLGPDLCVGPQYVFVPENPNDHGRLTAISRHTGERAWSLETKGGIGPRPVRTAENLYLSVSGERSRNVAVDFHASVLSLDPKGGDRYWKFRLWGYSPNAPVATGDSLYVTRGNRGEMSLIAFGY